MNRLRAHYFARQVVPESAIARAAAVALVGVMLLVQIFAITQLHINDKRHEVNSLVEGEYHRLEAALVYNSVQSLSAHEEQMMSENLNGLSLTSAAGRKLVDVGEVPDSSNVRELAKQGNGVWLMGKANQADVMWHMGTPAEPMTVVMRIDVASGIEAAWSRTRTRIFYALTMMLIIGVAALWLVNRLVTRYFVKPAEVLVDHIESWQEQARGDDIVNPVEACGGASHLVPIAETVSDLISQQKIADRQVRVKQKYLEFAAHHDPLTHLPNRLKFEETLHAISTNPANDGNSFAIFLVDLDNFKIFNDQYGHVVGDRMVSEVGNRLRALTGENDLIARLDGDEFVLIKSDIDNADLAQDVAEKIMEAASEPFIFRGFTMKVSVSIGISIYPLDVHGEHDVGQIGEELVNNASVALQESKTAGKNRFMFFTESMRSKLTERVSLKCGTSRKSIFKRVKSLVLKHWFVGIILKRVLSLLIFLCR